MPRETKQKQKQEEAATLRAAAFTPAFSLTIVADPRAQAPVVFATDSFGRPVAFETAYQLLDEARRVLQAQERQAVAAQAVAAATKPAPESVDEHAAPAEDVPAQAEEDR